MHKFLFLAEVIPPTEGGDSRFISEFFNMLFILGMLVATLYLGAWMFRRFTAQQMVKMNVVSKIKVIEQRNLSPKSILYILEVEGKTMLISESVANGVKHLTDL